jgi:hypothetical protein
VCIFICIFCTLCILIFHLHILAYSAYSAYQYLAYSTYCAYFAYFTYGGYVFHHYLIGDMQVSILHIANIEHINHIYHIFIFRNVINGLCQPHPSCHSCPFQCPAASSCSNAQYMDNTIWDVKRISRLSRRFLR